MRIAMAQINATIGDLEDNTPIIKGYISNAKKNNADIVTSLELAITGYPPQDLLLEDAFVKKNREISKELISGNSGVAGVVGFVDYRGKPCTILRLFS